MHSRRTGAKSALSGWPGFIPGSVFGLILGMVVAPDAITGFSTEWARILIAFGLGGVASLVFVWLRQRRASHSETTRPGANV